MSDHVKTYFSAGYFDEITAGLRAGLVFQPILFLFYKGPDAHEYC